VTGGQKNTRALEEVRVYRFGSGGCAYSLSALRKVTTGTEACVG